MPYFFVKNSYKFTTFTRQKKKAYGNSLSIMSLKFKVPETNSSMQIRVNKPTKKRSKKNEIPNMPQQSEYVFVSQHLEESSVNQTRTIIENYYSGQQSQVYNIQQFEINQAVNQDQTIIKNTQYIQPLDQSRQQSQVYDLQQIETNRNTQLQAVDYDQTLIRDTQYTQYTQHNQLLDQSGQHLQDHNIQTFETNQISQIQEEVYQNQTMIQNAQDTYTIDQSRQQSQVHDLQRFETNRAVNQDQAMTHDIQDIQQSLDQSGQSQMHNLQQFETNTNQDHQLHALDQQIIRFNIPVENLVELNVLENSVEIYFLPMINFYSPQLQEVNQDQDIQNNPH
ncbi:hypothetical protein C2G38_2034157 [Gigaspora rosea]|uniref:Uncharacterized protein n=1 Tax=Gigaspora rosea TaxID=44941 RepID=A0A397VGW3_9GLOM|nr:hypothetical protein C2G38_2034157 [Gigaspora rosea]